MSTFIGKYEAKADVKGRVFVPAAYRKLLSGDDRERLVVRKDVDHDCLIFYPERVWEQKLGLLRAGLNEWDAADQMLLLAFAEEAEWLEFDSQGRVLLSKENRQAIALEGSEVLFIGMFDRFALWSKACYEQVKLSREDVSERLKEISEKLRSGR